MKYFAVYVPDSNNSGQIIRAGQCDDNGVAAQAGAGEAAIETPSIVSSATHKILNGALVVQDNPPGPNPGTVFDAITLSDDGYIRAGAASYTEGNGIWIGKDPVDGQWKFRVGTASLGNVFKFNGTNLTLDIGSMRVGQDTPAAVNITPAQVRVSSDSFGVPETKVQPGLILIGDIQVLSSQKPAVTYSDGSEADNARAINEIIDRLTSHGLIA